WGFAHGLLLIIHKMTSDRFQWDNWVIRFFKVLVTFQIVSFLWIFFRASSITEAFESIEKIVVANNFLEFSSFLQARYEVLLLLLTSSFIVFTPEGFKQKVIQRILSLPLILWPILLLIILQLILQIREESIQPFIYFQF
ncbi:MAG: hypothetical protein EB023_13430, partial [Flavobacteriia bacterium]|nr:hypothetical protein [Flavobacteriia bacterium]